MTCMQVFAPFCDQKIAYLLGVVMNATNPGSPLNKKVIALAYHFVREHQANHVISVRKIHTTDNYSDPWTKAMNSNEFHGFYGNLLCNPGKLQ